MESEGEDLDNIFEDYENNENDAGAENTENNTANETPGAVKVAAPKRVVKNPRLKFNGDRLCGERGIPVLVNHFKNVKFKGPGHEEEDLDKLLTKLEHWTHRLFPSMKFEDCLTHIERLGKKRQVQTCLRKMRLGMPILSSDFVKDNDDDNVKRNEDFEPEEMSAFDRLLGETSNMDVSALENVSNSGFPDSSPMPNDTTGHVLGSSFGSSLTEEQKERMESNRMLAAERRKARIAAMEQINVTSPSKNQETTSSENVPNNESSFNQLLCSSEYNEEKAENSNESLEKSAIINQDDSEKLELDDLMNLVDEDDSVSNENATISLTKQGDSTFDRLTEINKVPPSNAQNLKNLDSVSESDKSRVLSFPESSHKRNLNVESSLDLNCETSVDYKINADCSMNNTSIRDENVTMDIEDLTSLDCENSHDQDSNINEISHPPDDAENLKKIENISKNSKNEIISSSQKANKIPEENFNSEISLDLASGTSVDSKVNINDVSSVNVISANQENVLVENDDLTSMDYEDTSKNVDII